MLGLNGIDLSKNKDMMEGLNDVVKRISDLGIAFPSASVFFNERLKLGKAKVANSFLYYSATSKFQGMPIEFTYVIFGKKQVMHINLFNKEKTGKLHVKGPVDWSFDSFLERSKNFN